MRRIFTHGYLGADKLRGACAAKRVLCQGAFAIVARRIVHPPETVYSVMVAAEGSNMWTWYKSWKDFKQDHLSVKSAPQAGSAQDVEEPTVRARVLLLPESSVHDWCAFAQFAGVSYGGTRYNAFGDELGKLLLGNVGPPSGFIY